MPQPDSLPSLYSLTHPRVLITLPLRGSGLGGREYADKLADISPTMMHKQVKEFLATLRSVLRYVSDVMDDIQEKLKEKADAKGR